MPLKGAKDLTRRLPSVDTHASWKKLCQTIEEITSYATLKENTLQTRIQAQSIFYCTDLTDAAPDIITD